MRIDRISYKRVFPTGALYINEHIGLEAEINEGENPVELIGELKKMAEQIHRENHPHLYVGGKISAPTVVDAPFEDEPSIQVEDDRTKPPLTKEEKRWKALTDACFSEKELAKFKDKCPKHIYEERLNQLKNA